MYTDEPAHLFAISRRVDLGEWTTWEGYSYGLFRSTTSRSDAEKICTGAGAQLLSIHSAEEQIVAAKLLQSASAWIGYVNWSILLFMWLMRIYRLIWRAYICMPIWVVALVLPINVCACTLIPEYIFKFKLHHNPRLEVDWPNALWLFQQLVWRRYVSIMIAHMWKRSINLIDKFLNTVCWVSCTSNVKVTLSFVFNDWSIDNLRYACNCIRVWCNASTHERVRTQCQKSICMLHYNGLLPDLQSQVAVYVYSASLCIFIHLDISIDMCVYNRASMLRFLVIN